MIIRIGAVAVATSVLSFAAAVAGAGTDSAETTGSKAQYHSIRTQIETLRGKKFLHEVPVARISEEELRKMSNEQLEKDYPGQKLTNYEELLAWFDMVPPHTDLKSVYANYMVDQVAGLYDSDTKTMYIPSFTPPLTNRVKAAEKKVEDFSGSMDDIVLAHEFTHALEDQYWQMDDPKDRDEQVSTDRDTAHGFLLEGSATRQMIEVVPAQSSEGHATRYFTMWNLLHSDLGEFVLKYALLDAWKDADALSEGVPEPLSRIEAIPYSFGYAFCTDILRHWGLDGLDYIYDHRPISSEQIMHPQKAWEWRDFPVQVNVPENLAGGWKQLSHDCAGEAGVAILLGCQLKNLDRGLELGSGWDGDRAALFEGANGKRLLVWASAWDSTDAAARCARAFIKERQMVHQAVVTKDSKGASARGAVSIRWHRPDGRQGIIQREGKHVVLVETDDADALAHADGIVRSVTFTEPSEDAARAALNSPLRRFNPLVSWQKDGDYTVTRTLAGVLSRHDRNSVGSADRFLLGLVGESRRTASFKQWELGAGGIARHQSESRRGFTKTTFLPWGLLASRCAARLPQTPDITIGRSSLIWGLGASATSSGPDKRSYRVLPFGLLFQNDSAPDFTSVHVLGTGISRKTSSAASGTTASITRLRVLCIPIWTKRSVHHHDSHAAPERS